MKAVGLCLRLSKWVYSMIKINFFQRKRINKLINKLCCNCFEGNCLLLDYGEPCKYVQMIKRTTICCNYFLNAVLPVDKELYSEIMADTKSKRCKMCQKHFLPNSHNQRFCEACSKIRNRQKATERQRKKRASMSRK